MKKILALITAIALICSMAICVSATGTPTLTIASVEGAAGETVEVCVDLSNSPALQALTVRITYDEALTLTDVAADGGAFNGKGTFMPGGNPTYNPYGVMWYATDDYACDGTFAKLLFAVPADAVAGTTYPITLYVEDAYNNDDDIAFDVVAGGITVPEADDDEDDEIVVDGPTLRITSAKDVAAGDVVELAIELLEAPVLQALTVRVSYDEALTLTDVAADGGAFAGKGTFMPGGNPAFNPYGVMWYATDDHQGAGTFAKLAFKVPENAAAGTAYTVTLEVEDAYNNDDDITFDVIEGTITVGGEPVSSIEGINLTKDGDKLVVATENALTAKLVVVTYDANNTLVDADFIDVELAAQGTGEYTADVEAGAKTKAMLWSDLVNCEPLVDALVY